MKTEKNRKGLEEAIKEKVSPLLEQTMEKSWGITIPKLETDITDRLRQPQLHIYVPITYSFHEAKNFFKSTFLKRELRLHRGNVSQLAKTLELDRRSIHRVIKGLDIKMNQVRQEDYTKEQYQEEIIDRTIRQSLDQYKEIIHPHKMEQMYQEVPALSRNIAKFLPHPEMTWKEAENEFERQFLRHALDENQGNVSKTAHQLEIRAETLHRKMKKLGLRKE